MRWWGALGLHPVCLFGGSCTSTQKQQELALLLEYLPLPISAAVEPADLSAVASDEVWNQCGKMTWIKIILKKKKKRVNFNPCQISSLSYCTSTGASASQRAQLHRGQVGWPSVLTMGTARLPLYSLGGFKEN